MPTATEFFERQVIGNLKSTWTVAALLRHVAQILNSLEQVPSDQK